MSDRRQPRAYAAFHSHVLPRAGPRSERAPRPWAVIWLCAAMMRAEIVGGWLFGSIALIADGLHMSTHAGALLLAALAYSFARRYARRSALHLRHGQARRSRGLHQRDHSGDDRAFHRLGGGAASSARSDPFPRGDPDRRPRPCRQRRQRLAAHGRRGIHGHSHSHGHGHSHAADEPKRFPRPPATPPRRLRGRRSAALPPLGRSGPALSAARCRRHGAAGRSRQIFASPTAADSSNRSTSFRSRTIRRRAHNRGRTTPVVFEEHGHAHGAAARDNNMRAAIVHVIADATVSLP